MCLKNGSPLSLVRNMRGLKELQGLLTLPHLYDDLLLALLRRYIYLALERGIER